MVEIDERDGDERSAESQEKHVFQTLSQLEKQNQAEDGGGRLHQRIPGRDGVTAVPAPAQKKKVAEHRQVVIKPDSFPAMGTARRGVDDGLIKGHAIDADIEEAPESQAEKTRKDHSYRHSKDSSSREIFALSFFLRILDPVL